MKVCIMLKVEMSLSVGPLQSFQQRALLSCLSGRGAKPQKFCVPQAEGCHGREQGAMASLFFLNHHIFGRTFTVDKDNGFEVYWKIFELGPPTLQVPWCL